MFKTESTLFHPIESKASVVLPKQFTYPFYYQPHPLCIQAAEDVKAYLNTQTDFEHNFGLDSTKQGLKIGKMFGVMIVETTEKQLGYIVSFSGKLAERNYLNGFVPPIYDTLNKHGFYKQGEALLNRLNAKIQALEQNPELEKAELNFKQTQLEAVQKLVNFKSSV